MMSEWCQAPALLPAAAKGGSSSEEMTSKASSNFPLCKPPKKRYLEDMNHASSPPLNHQSKFSKPMEGSVGRRRNGASEEQPLNLCMEKEKTITGSQGSLISRMVDKLFCDSSSQSSTTTLLDSFLQQMSAHSKPYPASDSGSTPLGPPAPSRGSRSNSHRSAEYNNHHSSSKKNHHTGGESLPKAKKHSASSTSSTTSSSDTRQSSSSPHHNNAEGGPYAQPQQAPSLPPAPLKQNSS